MKFCKEMWWLSLQRLLIYFSLNQSSDSYSATFNHGANKLKIMSPLFVVKCQCWATQHVCQHSTSFPFFLAELFTCLRGGRAHLCTNQADEREHTAPRRSLSTPVINSRSCLTLINNAVATLTETFYKDCPILFLFSGKVRVCPLLRSPPSPPCLPISNHFSTNFPSFLPPAHSPQDTFESTSSPHEKGRDESHARMRTRRQKTSVWLVKLIKMSIISLFPCVLRLDLCTCVCLLIWTAFTDTLLTLFSRKSSLFSGHSRQITQTKWISYTCVCVTHTWISFDCLWRCEEAHGVFCSQPLSCLLDRRSCGVISQDQFCFANFLLKSSGASLSFQPGLIDT